MIARLSQLVQSRPGLRYLVAGGLAFTADYSCYISLYYLAGTSIRVAADVGFAFGWVVSFFLNRHWVFSHAKDEDNPKQAAQQSVLYTLLVLVNLIFTNYTIVWLFNHGVKPYLAKVIIVAMITCWNFIIFKKIVFRKTKAGSAHES